jgi:hypothetical protein
MSLLTAALAVFSIWAFAFKGKLVQTYKDPHVAAGDIWHPYNAISPHSGMSHYLEIDGMIYRNVRGFAPYFMEIPQLNSILFVTTQEDSGRIHLINLATSKEIAIDGVGPFFGSHIGSIRKPGEDLTDYVVRVEDDNLVVATRSGTRVLQICLDLKNQRIAWTKETNN